MMRFKMLRTIYKSTFPCGWNPVSKLRVSSSNNHGCPQSP